MSGFTRGKQLAQSQAGHHDGLEADSGSNPVQHWGFLLRAAQDDQRIRHACVHLVQQFHPPLDRPGLVVRTETAPALALSAPAAMIARRYHSELAPSPTPIVDLIIP